VEVIVSGIEARPTSGKLENTGKDLRERHFLTGQPVGSGRRALDTVHLGYYIVSDSVSIEATSDDNLVKITAHGAKKGDLCRIISSTNNIQEFEIAIDEIVDANSFRLGAVLSASLEAGDTVTILRAISPKFSDTGAQYVLGDPAPIAFRKDGALQEVVLDTATPSNNEPLPVKLMGINGTINLTANDLDISSDHAEDSIAIGDGTTIAAVKPITQELKVNDADTNAKLVDTNDYLNTIAGNTTDASSFLSGIQNIVSLEATQLLIHDLINDLKTLQTTQNTHTDGIEGKLDSLIAKDYATQTTLAALKTVIDLHAKLSDTQPVSAASLPLPTGAATSAKQDTVITSLGNIDTDLGAPADTAVTSPAASGSVIALLKGLLTLIASTNTKLDTLDTNSSPDLNSTANMTSTGSTTVTPPASARGMIIQNSTESATAIRIAGSAQTPSASVGFFLGPGQSTSYMPAGPFKYFAVDGVAPDACVLWFV
jgi:hypothetical protein